MTFFIKKSNGKSITQATANRLIANTKSVKQASKIVTLTDKADNYELYFVKEIGKMKILKKGTKYLKDLKAKDEQLRQAYQAKMQEARNMNANLFENTGKYIYHHKEIKKNWIHPDFERYNDVENKGKYFLSFYVEFGVDDVVGAELKNKKQYDEQKKIFYDNTKNPPSKRGIRYNIEVKSDGTPLNQIIDTAIYSSFATDVAASKVLVLKVSNIHFTPQYKADYKEIVMRGEKIAYRLLGDLSKINKIPGQCLIDSIMYVIQNSRYIKKVNRKYVAKFFNADGSGTYEQLFKLAKALKNLRVTVISPMGAIVASYKPEGYETNHNVDHMAFIINNGHCYPILSEEIKTMVLKQQRLDLGEIKVNIKLDNNYVYVDNDDYMENKQRILNGEYETETPVILLETNELFEEIANKVMTKTTAMVHNIQISRSGLQAFEHPLSKQIYMKCQQYNERKAVCEAMYQELPCNKLKFNNQSWKTIGYDYCTAKYGEIQPSQYGPDYVDIIKRYPLAAYRGKCLQNTEYYENLENDKGWENFGIYSYDCHRNFTSAYMFNKHGFPVYTSMDKKEKYNNQDLVCGEYYVAKSFYIANKTQKYPRSWYPYHFVQYCIENGYITHDDITMQHLASFKIPADHFSDFVTEMYEKYPSESKDIVNHMNGFFGRSEMKFIKGCFTDDVISAMAVINDELEQGKECDLDYCNGLYFVQSKKSAILHEGHVPIHRHIIASSYILLDKLHNEITRKFPTCKVLSYAVDAIKIFRSDNEDNDLLYVKPGGMFPSAVKTTVPGMIFREYSPLIRGYYMENEDFAKRPKDNIEDLKWNIIDETRTNIKTIDSKIQNESCLVNGVGGSGKTYKLVQLLKTSDKKIIGFCFTNNAVDVINVRSGESVFQTFDSFFCEHQSTQAQVEKLYKYDIVAVDEISMVDARLLNLLCICKRMNPKIQFKFFGDFNQCLPIEKHSKIYDYENSPVMHFLCDGNKINLLYKPELGRYGQDLYDVLDKLLKTGKVDECVSRKEVESFKNLCYFRATAKDVNQKCLNRFIEQNPNNKIYIVSGMRILKGVPLVVDNLKLKAKYELMTSQKFVISEIDKETITIKNDRREVKITNEDFANNFAYGYCITTHRIQGDKIDSHYNIYDSHSSRFTRNLIYTAMSRSTKLEFIHFPNHVRSVYEKAPITNECYPLGIHRNLIKATIYKIEGKDWVYVGQTQKPLEERYQEHLEAPTNKEMKKKLNDKTDPHKIEVIMECLFKNERDIKALEQEYIEHFITIGLNAQNVIGTKNIKKQLAKKEKMKKAAQVVIEWKDETKFVPTYDEKNKYWTIQFRDENGKLINVKRRANKISKEQAYEAIMEERKQLLTKYC